MRDGVLWCGGCDGESFFFSVFWGGGGSDGPNNCDLLVSVLLFCTFLVLKDLRLSFVPDYSIYILICFCCLSCSFAFRYHLF